jgi:hypothetical protein
MDELYLYIVKALQHLYFQSRQIDRLDECNDEFVGAFEAIYNLTKEKLQLTRNQIINYNTGIIEDRTLDKYYHLEKAIINLQIFFKCSSFKLCKRNVISLRPIFDALIEYTKLYTKKSEEELLASSEKYNTDDNISEEDRNKAFNSFNRNIDISNI